jgi:hypothetical protein
MTVVRYILSIVVLLAALYVVVGNWCAAIISIRNSRRGIDQHHSTVPFISFIPTLFGICLFPHPDKAAWMLAVPILDIGNLNLLFFLLFGPVLIARRLLKKKPNETKANSDR